MKITFTQTRRISEDGFAIRLCEAGQSYDVADTAARMAINAGWAEKFVEAPLTELMDNLGLRLEYGEFLNDTRNPPLTFAEWKAKRPVATNHHTHTDIGGSI